MRPSAGEPGAVRAADEVFRIVGGELAVLLPDTDLAGARRAAERLAATLGAEAGTWGVAERAGDDPAQLHAGAAPPARR